MKKNKTTELLSKISHLFKKGKRKSSKSLESLLALASREPTNPYPHLKIAEIYQKAGDKQNALREFLRAAEISCDFEHYRKGAAIYTKILKQDPHLDFVKVKLAEAYRKMGFFAQAFALYHKLYYSYSNAGVEDKALEMLGSMAELDPQKFTMSEKDNLESAGFEKAKGQPPNEKSKEINFDQPLKEEKGPLFDLTATLETNHSFELDETKSITIEENYRTETIFEELHKTKDAEKLYLNFNYQMGLVCKEMGLVNEAIKQLQVAVERGQKPTEASELLSQCIKDKGGPEKWKSFKGMLKEESAVA